MSEPTVNPEGVPPGLGEVVPAARSPASVDATLLGTPSPQPAASFVAITPIQGRNGYMIVGGDGGGFACGETGPLGALVRSPLNQPIVAAVAY